VLAICDKVSWQKRRVEHTGSTLRFSQWGALVGLRRPMKSIVIECGLGKVWKIIE